jgi:hypothetical protein
VKTTLSAKPKRRNQHALKTIISLIVVLATGSAFAQNPPANNGPNNKAVNSKSENNPGAPVTGANSFTEGQGKSRIKVHGYSNITDLKKGRQ